jgi:uncharacterized protein (TIGR03663 family)
VEFVLATKTKRKKRPHPFKIEEPAAVAAIEPQIEASPAVLPWLTLETVLYAVIVIVAVALRLSNLGLVPLSNAEAGQALSGLELYRGGVPAGDYSPLLLTLNTLSFLLFGVSDASARLAPMLFGSVLVILPLTLRRRVGPVVCLVAAALLAISPTAVFLSRTLNSEIAVATASLLIFAGFFNWTEDGQRRWLWLLAAGLAILPVAGPMAYAVIVVFGLIVLLRYPLFKALWAEGLAKTAAQPAAQVRPPGEPDGASPDREIGLDEAGADRSTAARKPDGLQQQTDRRDENSINRNLRDAGIFFAVTLLLLATAATFNFSGLGVATTFFVDWLNNFGGQVGPEAGFNAIFLLTIYEPLVLLAGLSGIALAILRRDLLGLLLVIWFAGLLVLDVVMGGRPNGSVILPLVPLVFLAAFALAELWEGLRLWGTWGNEGALLLTGLVITVFAYIGLTGWLERPCTPEDTICQYSWLQAGAALVLFLVVVFFFGFMSDGAAALRGAALAGTVIGLLATISVGWRLNFGPLMDLGYQPLAGVPASTGLVQLTETLADESESRVGDATLLDVAWVGPASPALAWRLRDYRHLSQTNSLLDAPATAIITPASDRELAADQPYIGQDFALDAIWSPVGLPPKQLVEWLIYRHMNERPQGNTAVLWLRVE